MSDDQLAERMVTAAATAVALAEGSRGNAKLRQALRHVLPLLRELSESDSEITLARLEGELTRAFNLTRVSSPTQ